MTPASGAMATRLACEFSHIGIVAFVANHVVGLAGDYCVKATAVDAAKAGFKSYVVEEGTKCVSSQDWDAVKSDLHKHNVKVISADGAEIGRVRDIGLF